MTESNNITDKNIISTEKEEKPKKKKQKSKIKQESDKPVEEDTATPVCNANNKQLTTCDAFVTSITQNYKSWVCMFVAIYFVSKPNLIEGYFTFGVMLLFSYYINL